MGEKGNNDYNKLHFLSPGLISVSRQISGQPLLFPITAMSALMAIPAPSPYTSISITKDLRDPIPGCPRGWSLPIRVICANQL
jgi:hypothetical protein